MAKKRRNIYVPYGYRDKIWIFWHHLHIFSYNVGFACISYCNLHFLWSLYFEHVLGSGSGLHMDPDPHETCEDPQQRFSLSEMSLCLWISKICVNHRFQQYLGISIPTSKLDQVWIGSGGWIRNLPNHGVGSGAPARIPTCCRGSSSLFSCTDTSGIPSPWWVLPIG